MSTNAAYMETPGFIEARKLEVYQPSILFTTDNLITIKDYVRKASGLSTDPYEIAHSLGSNRLALGGALLDDIVKLHAEMVEHANTWPELESRSSQLSLQLENFSNGFLLTINNVIKLIERTQAYQQFGSVLKDVEALSTAEGEALSEGDGKALTTIGDFLVSMKESVGDYQTKVEDVYQLAKKFAWALEYQLPPQLARVREEVKNKQIDDHLADYDKLIKALNLEIDDVRADAEKYEGYSWFAPFFGVLGVALGHFTVGAEGREARARLDALVERRDNAHREVARLNPLKVRLLKYEIQLVDLAARMNKTKEAAQSLQQVWAAIDAQVSDSQHRAKRIVTTTDLFLFLNSLEIISAAWTKTQSQSRALNRAYQEFAEMYEHQSAKGSVL